MTPADIKLYVHELEAAIAGNSNGIIKIMELDVKLAVLFVDFLKNLDPDMARIWRQALPQPLLPLLGPIVGEEMINTKLRRLDDLAEQLGTAALLLATTVTQMDTIARRREL